MPLGMYTDARRGAAALLILLLAAAASAQPASVPALPDLPLETFPADARAALTAALDLARQRPDDAAAVGGLGIVLQAWEQWDAAHAAYGRAEALAPSNADWPYLDGMVLQRLARPGEAAARFERAVSLAPTLVAARARLAEVLFGAGDLEASARAYEALVDQPGAAAIAELGLGRIAARQGRHADAVAHFERAVARFPEFGAAYYGLAQSLRALDRREDARAALDRHREHGARWPEIDDPLAARVAAVREDALAQLSRGLRLAESGDLAGAIEAHESALRTNPSVAQAHVNLISLYGRSQQWAKAEAHYRAALDAHFNEDEAHYNYGVLLGAQGRWDEAEEAFRRAVAVNPMHARARNNLGQMLERKRATADAMDEYRKAVDADPRFRLARYNLGRMLLASRRFDEAAAEFEKLREPEDAETPRYRFALAVAHVQAGRRAEGLEVARDARRLAEAFGQHELTAAIDREIASLQ